VAHKQFTERGHDTQQWQKQQQHQQNATH